MQEFVDMMCKSQGKYFPYFKFKIIFSSPGQSPGRTIALSPALASVAASGLAKSLTLKFFM